LCNPALLEIIKCALIELT